MTAVTHRRRRFSRSLAAAGTLLATALTGGCTGSVLGDPAPSTMALDHVDSFHAIEMSREVRARLQRGDLDGAKQLIDETGLGSALSQVVWLSSNVCSPTTVEFLLDEVGVNPRASERGRNSLYEIAAEGIGRADCADTVRAESVRLIIDAGGNPCRAPEGDPALSPAVLAESWGESPEVVAALSRPC